MRKFLGITFAVLCMFVLTRIYYAVTDDFRIQNITHEMPYHPEWEVPSLTLPEQEQLQAVLSQPFSYVGKGAQSYVFSSADNKYVLKFFKFKHLKPSLFVSLLPHIPPFAEYQEKEMQRKERKLQGVFTGYKLAYEKHRDESGLFFVQLNPTHRKELVAVVDKLGLSRAVDLGETVFIIQKKAKPLKTVLSDALEANNLLLAKERIGQVFDLYRSEYRKGIYDRDHGVTRNVGFINDIPIHLDVGKLTKEGKMMQPEVASEDLAIVITRLQEWLQSHYPQHQKELTAYMEARKSEAFSHEKAL